MTRPKKPIEQWQDDELDSAIKEAAEKVPGFWLIMRGVDAYMERRSRRIANARAEEARRIDAEFHEDNLWGNS